MDGCSQRETHGGRDGGCGVADQAREGRGPLAAVIGWMMMGGGQGGG